MHASTTRIATGERQAKLTKDGPRRPGQYDQDGEVLRKAR